MTDDDIEKIIPWVRRVRTTLRYTQREFCKMLGITAPTLWKCETKNYPLSPEARRRLVEIARQNRLPVKLDDTL